VEEKAEAVGAEKAVEGRAGIERGKVEGSRSSGRGGGEEREEGEGVTVAEEGLKEHEERSAGAEDQLREDAEEVGARGEHQRAGLSIGMEMAEGCGAGNSGA